MLFYEYLYYFIPCPWNRTVPELDKDPLDK